MSIQVKKIAGSLKDKAEELSRVLEGIIRDPSIPTEKKVNLIIHGTSLICAIVAIQPIPFADLYILTPIQVVMVTAISRVLGNPLGENKAKEVISYVIGVIGWGVLAQQVVLGLYKTVLPFMGALTTIPLVYTATFGLGTAAKIVLEAREKDQTVSQKKLKEAVSEEMRRVKAENKIDWSLRGLTAEWAKLSQYKEYEERIEELNKQLEMYKAQHANQQQYSKDSLSQVDVANAWRSKVDNLRQRYSQYTRAQITNDALLRLSLMSTEQLHRFEEFLASLQNTPGMIKVDKFLDGRGMQEVVVNQVGRIYLSYNPKKSIIYSVETNGDVQEYSLISALQAEMHQHVGNKQLSNAEIVHEFRRAFVVARQEVNIRSPWIAHWATNQDFTHCIEGALKRGVVVKIHYGILDDSTGKPKSDDQSDSNAQKLKVMFARYGSLFRIQKGNSHFKLLLCDEQFYLIGSLNFLSFKGIYTPDTRHEGAELSENVQLLNSYRQMFFDF